MLKQGVFQPVPLDQHAHPHLKLLYFAVSYFRSLIYSKPHVAIVYFFLLLLLIFNNISFSALTLLHSLASGRASVE